ncbi:PqiA protein [[Mannheimia] succiniciproducens MBEL55E]|uniref:PqiA protein n=1 Tax=Mannheimia succiniciproducens (strain KCTC 0769BP / MBEL55E) TaxID=221988 RepID=Q65UD4_MANSM|nr:PqiA protein [[Mannheimia] succiniciproducens MBEL55E]
MIFDQMPNAQRYIRKYGKSAVDFPAKFLLDVDFADKNRSIILSD